MFEQTIKYFGFLKKIPLLPHLFDGMMKIEKFVNNRNVLNYIDEIEKEVLSWNHTSVHIHRFGGIQFDVNKKEIGHIHGNGLLDILFKKEIKEQLIKEGRVREHHTFKKSGWISFYIRDEQDKKFAIELLEYSYLIKM
jgi:hypothetical protein